MTSLLPLQLLATHYRVPTLLAVLSVAASSSPPPTAASVRDSVASPSLTDVFAATAAAYIPLATDPRLLTQQRAKEEEDALLPPPGDGPPHPLMLRVPESLSLPERYVLADELVRRRDAGLLSEHHWRIWEERLRRVAARTDGDDEDGSERGGQAEADPGKDLPLPGRIGTGRGRLAHKGGYERKKIGAERGRPSSPSCVK